MNVLLPLLVTIPLGTGFVLALLPEKRTATAGALAVGVSAATLAGALAVLGRELTYDVGGWAPPVGVVLSLDGFSGLLLPVVATVVLASTLYSTASMRSRAGRTGYFALLMILLAGMNGVLLSGDIFNRFVYVEVAAIASYVLVGLGRGTGELKAALRYAILGALASAVTLLGIALLYVLHGTVNIAHLSEKIHAAGPVGIATSVASMSMVLFFCSFAFKSALAPLHVWQPDVVQHAPAPVAALIAGALIEVIGVYAMVRIAFAVFGVTRSTGWLMAALGMLSMAVGVALSFRQHDVRRFLAYHGVAHTGYVLAAFGVGGVLLSTGDATLPAALALAGGALHLVNQSLFQSLLFLSAGAFRYAADDNGAHGPSPGFRPCGSFRTQSVWYAGVLSSAGIPPFGGCISKTMIIAALIMSGYSLVAAVAVAAAVLTIVSFLHFHAREPRDRGGRCPAAVRSIPPGMQAALMLLALLSLATGFFAFRPVRAAVLEPAGRGLAGANGEFCADRSGAGGAETRGGMTRREQRP